VTVEPELGQCTATDDFVAFHRQQDMALKSEEVRQAELETQRLQERLNLRLLGDPTPFEGAASVRVATSPPDDLPTPPSET